VGHRRSCAGRPAVNGRAFTFRNHLAPLPRSRDTSDSDKDPAKSAAALRANLGLQELRSLHELARELLRLAPKTAERQPQSVEIELLGRRWDVEYVTGRRVRTEEVADERLRIHAPSLTDRHASQALVPWLMRLASHSLSARLKPLSAELDIDYARMSVRRQRTRWGSCSTRGTISLNVCLMFQRPEVVRYLMVHELCHRRHMNHSRRFWSLVESFEPGWKPLDVELLQGWRNVPAWVFP